MAGIIKIFIVADQPAIRKGLTMRITAEPDLEVIGEACCDVAASNLAQSLCPDIVLVDADMADLRGVITASQIHHALPQAAIVMLSIQDDMLTCEQAENAGAVAFISKLMPAEALIEAIRHVAGSVN